MPTVNRSHFAILSLLRLGPQSGYELRANCEALLSHFWSESYGSIYPTLRRLAAEGLILEVPADQSESDRQRKTFELTDAGLAALQDWLAEPPVERNLRDELMLKLLSGATVPPDVYLGHLTRQKLELDQNARELAVHEQRLNAEHANSPDAVHWRLILRAGIITTAARLQWCQEAIAALENTPQPAAQTIGKDS